MRVSTRYASALAALAAGLLASAAMTAPAQAVTLTGSGAGTRVAPRRLRHLRVAPIRAGL
jgi:hypothetical protein